MAERATVMVGIPCLMVGGTEIQTLRLVEALTGSGYRCVTVCYFEYDYAMVEQYKLAGSEVVCLSAYGKRPQGSVGVYRFLKAGLKRVVAEYRPEVAHIQYMAPGAIPIVILKLLGIKTIIATLHTDASIYKSPRLVHWLQRHCVRAFTCVSEAAERSFFGSSRLYDSYLALGKRNHFTLPNCLPPNTKIGSPKKHDKETPTIGMVARLETIKGTDLALPAFAKVLEQKPDCKLIIVGDGSLRKTMQRQQRALGIADDRVLWTGRVGHGELAELYEEMDLVWMPSRTEGFGLSAIEAMAQGLPVVAAATGGLTEIITDGDNGLLFKKEDSNDLAEKSLQLLNDESLRRRMSERAQERAEDYTFERYRGLVQSLYGKLILQS